MDCCGHVARSRDVERTKEDEGRVICYVNHGMLRGSNSSNREPRCDKLCSSTVSLVFLHACNSALVFLSFLYYNTGASPIAFIVALPFLIRSSSTSPPSSTSFQDTIPPPWPVYNTQNLFQLFCSSSTSAMATTAHAPSGYSSIFASGLLATPRPHRHTDSGSSPMAEDLESTPTGLKSHISEYPPSPTPSYITEMESEHSRSRASSTASVSSFTAPPPRLRRRRSSLTVGTSVMGNIKSPLRSAGNALQRTVLMSPTGGSRSRSGSLSVDVNNVPQPMSASLNGRMRSGSVGDALRYVPCIILVSHLLPPMLIGHSGYADLVARFASLLLRPRPCHCHRHPCPCLFRFLPLRLTNPSAVLCIAAIPRTITINISALT